MTRHLTAAAALSALLCAAAPRLSADVQLSVDAGRISIVARDATAAEILTQWASIGQTRVLNAERMSRERMTIELTNVAEERALDIVLRNAGGYLAAPRAIAMANASRFDRIIVVPNSVVLPTIAAAPARRELPAPAAPETMEAVPPAAPSFEPAPPDERYDEPPPVNVAGPPVGTIEQAAAGGRRQALETVDPRHFKLPPATSTGAGATPAAAVPVGVPVPGMIAGKPSLNGAPGAVRR